MMLLHILIKYFYHVKIIKEDKVEKLYNEDDDVAVIVNCNKWSKK